VWCHTAVPERSWIGRLRSPYQRARGLFIHGVARSLA
jgi:hypothetical protein